MKNLLYNVWGVNWNLKRSNSLLGPLVLCSMGNQATHLVKIETCQHMISGDL